MALRCEYCNDLVWVPFKEATLILNGEKKCKCSVCAKNKIWKLEV